MADEVLKSKDDESVVMEEVVDEEMLEDYNVPDEDIVKSIDFVDEDFGSVSFDLSDISGVLDIKKDVMYVEDEVFEGLIDSDGFYTIEKDVVVNESTQETKKATKKIKVKKVRNRNKRDKNRIIIGRMRDESFGDLLPFVNDVNITDINWNGKQLWIDDVNVGRYLSEVSLTKEFVDAFSVRVSNVVSKSFNKYTPTLEAETDELRITIVHESVSGTGRTISIRKTPAVKRINFMDAVKNGDYCSMEMANFISNCVKSKMNVLVCGIPGVGKTELVKYLTNYVSPRDRVITIEDTFEIHYSKINPDKDCLEFRVIPKTFDYTAAIKASLRLLPQWILLSEARSTEVQYLIESVSTGTKCMTTLHTDDVRKIPDRILNMMDIDNANEEAITNQIYSFFDIGILVERDQDSSGRVHRYISQVCIFDREDGVNTCSMIMDDREVVSRQVPKDAMKRFKKMGISNPFEYTRIRF